MVADQARKAKCAAQPLSLLSTDVRNNALRQMADALLGNVDAILTENRKDVAAATARGTKASFIERLTLDEKRISDMAQGLYAIAALPDPIGSADHVVRRPNGLSIEARRVPLGVIGIVYESRPNVTADAAGLCIKSGNACVLRGGSEAIFSNIVIVDCMKTAAVTAGVPADAIQLLTDASRESVNEMLTLNGLIDVVIPRGGAGLIATVVKNATVPVIQTGVGVCHTYVEASADLNMAAAIVENAKCSRPSVCNAMETLLVDRAIAKTALPVLAAVLTKHHVELRCDEAAHAILPDCILATEADWSTEYNDLILSVKVVDGIEQAMAHIAKYTTGHSEAIITNDYEQAERFLNTVDAAAVYVNASTRFTDGGEFGLGAEIGISTQKLHARGPMGLSALTTVKYVVRGMGQIR